VHFRISFATIALLGLCAAPSVYGQGPRGQAQPGPQTAQQPQQQQQQQQQQPGAPKTGPSSIALVDVGYILKKHPNMNANMEAIKAEMTQAQEDIETRRKSLLAESEMVGKTYNPDTPDFKQKQEALISAESKLRVDFMGKEKEFAEKQAGVIYNSYQSINSAITEVATFYKYDIVLRYSREQNEMDPKKPQTVNFGIQRDVLFHNPEVDVTELVLSVLNSRVPAAPMVVAPKKDPNKDPNQGPRGAGIPTPPRR
jgi:Skp family chaperone for outer membrane proteins